MFEKTEFNSLRTPKVVEFNLLFRFSFLSVNHPPLVPSAAFAGQRYGVLSMAGPWNRCADGPGWGDLKIQANQPAYLFQMAWSLLIHGDGNTARLAVFVQPGDKCY